MAANRWLERHWTGLALTAAALVMAAPLWCVRDPAMPDYAAHLASFWMIGGGIAAGAAHPAYTLQWGFVPNLASEIIVPDLAQVTGLETATRLFFTTAILLWVMGTGAVHRALYGRTGIAPLLGALFAYNANFMWGFFNYYFAAGLSLVLFAAWIGNDASPDRARPLRLAGFMLGVTFLYFCHVFAVAALLLMIAGYETALHWRTPRAWLLRAARTALIYLPAGLAFLFLKPASAGDARLEFNLLDTMQDRFESLILHAFDDLSYVLPILLLGGLTLALIWGKARIHPAMRLVLGLMLLAALVAPEWAMGGWAVHLRLPALFAVLLFAACEISLPARIRPVLAGVLLLVIAGNAAGLAFTWRGYDRQYAEFRAALPQVPRHARLLTVLDGDAIGERADQPYWHMAELAIPARSAFTALMFTTKGQHVVQLRPPYNNFAAATAQQGSPPDVDELAMLAKGDLSEDDDVRDTTPYLTHFQCHYDMAVVVHLDGRRTPVPATLKLRHQGSFFALYDILPDATCRR